jgi:hypothetical protein
MQRMFYSVKLFMDLSSCYLECLDCFGLRHADWLKSWVGGYTVMDCFVTFVFTKQRRLSHEILLKADERNGGCIMAWGYQNMAACCWQQQKAAYLSRKCVSACYLHRMALASMKNAELQPVIIDLVSVISRTAEFFHGAGLSRLAYLTAALTAVHCTL